jgi:anthranilate synthase component I
LTNNWKTCIALRTMLVKDGVAYLQAGGGIVFDSDPYDEWMETINKLGMFVVPLAWPRPWQPADSHTTGANIHCITSAEEKYFAEQNEGKGSTADSASGTAKTQGGKTHIELAAG